MACDNMKKYITLILAFFISVLSLCFMPVLTHAGPNNTTIIALDPNRDYAKGEKVTVTVGISSTDGSYLKSANCGFGYNGATMRLLTETDTPDHFLIESDAPKKWLYYDLEFEMIADGKMYFIAGAYSGDGVIKAIKADGSRIDLPRASVVLKIGTGIYTKVSDCNLDTVMFSDEFGEEIVLNRPFNKNETEYWAEVNSDSVTIDANTENTEDKVIIPDLTLQPGENIKEIYVEATDGTRKTYTFHFNRPAHPVSVSNIELYDSKGNLIPYKFSEDTLEYFLEVETDVDTITFKGNSESRYVSFEAPEEKELQVGYNNISVKAKSDTDEKIYSYNIFRKSQPLRLLSLIGELSDETTLIFDQEFDPEVFQYTARCTSDIQSVKFLYTAGEGTVLESDPVFPLNEGVNLCKLVVSDGSDKQTYQITVMKDAYDQTEKEEVIQGPIHNDRDITGFQFKDFRILYFISIIILIGLIGFIILQLKKKWEEYENSSERIVRKEEKERKKRMKEKRKTVKIRNSRERS